MIRIMIDEVAPVAKGRPRFLDVGGEALYLIGDLKSLNAYHTSKLKAILERRRHPVTPKKTRTFEKIVKLEALSAMRGRPALEKPIIIVVGFYLKPPRTIPKDRLGLPAVKPDLDNLVKAIKDALNGVAYKDDSLITASIAYEFYSEKEGVEILLIETEETRQRCFLRSVLDLITIDKK